ncbi:hypothetical protein M1706_23380 [Salmonella enterica subsp. enterica serovar Anatum]|nr:hypothetical protein [Salmonella enterica subsp. enterica serovar Anatum]
MKGLRNLASLNPVLLLQTPVKGPGETRVWYRTRPFWLTVTCALLFAMPLICGA